MALISGTAVSLQTVKTLTQGSLHIIIGKKKIVIFEKGGYLSDKREMGSTFMMREKEQEGELLVEGKWHVVQSTRP